MGGGGPSSTTVTQPSAPQQVPAQIPPELSGLISGSATGLTGLQQWLNQTGSGMSTFAQPAPQQIPGLTPTQQALMGLSTIQPFFGPLTPEQQMASAGAQQFMAGQSAPQQMATGIENQFLGLPPAGGPMRGQGEVRKGDGSMNTLPVLAGPMSGAPWKAGAPVDVSSQGVSGTAAPPASAPQLAPIGQSPLTLQGMQAWRDLVAPTVMQQQALQGTAHGGAALEALAQSGEAAAVPLIQQEIQNRMGLIPQLQGQAGLQASMVPQLTGLGAAGFGQQQQAIGSALQSAQMPYDVAQAQAQANYADYLRRAQLAQQAFEGPLMQFGPSMISPAQTVFPQTQTTTQHGGGFMGK